jgi:hypothetical protein
MAKFPKVRTIPVVLNVPVDIPLSPTCDGCNYFSVKFLDTGAVPLAVYHCDLWKFNANASHSKHPICMQHVKNHLGVK